MAKKKKEKTSITIQSKETKIVLGLLLFALGAAFTLAPFVAENYLMNKIVEFVGVSSVAWGLLIIIISLRLLTKIKYFDSNKTLVGAILASISIMGFLSFWIPEDLTNNIDLAEYAGILGKILHVNFQAIVGKPIEFIILIIIGLIAFSLLSGISLEDIFGSAFKPLNKLAEDREKRKGEEPVIVGGEADEKNSDDDTDLSDAMIVDSNGKDKDDQLSMDDLDDDDNVIEIEKSDSPTQTPSQPIITTNDEDDDEESTLVEPQYPNWKFPPLDLLMDPKSKQTNEDVHKRNAVIIEKTLRSFGVESRINKITIGPTVVQYALSITVGTKVSRVRNLSNDLALALATSESQIRIEAPIPGTSLIGIEIPNPTPNFVYVKELVKELRKEQEKFALPLILGKSVDGKNVIQDLAKMPHILVAGATGTGKSVGINTIITGLLMTKTPDELKLILVDPKMVEMAPYNGLPHLMTPVITDMELVINALQWTVEEMLRRYRILKQMGARNITEYNIKSDGLKMPYLVLIFDEVADLMLSTGVDVETKIVRLTQMARAVGIHLILATQRPSVDVITGLIKANVPGRVSFSVSTAIDSRVIIDQTGAETLIGNGDMLFKSPKLNRPIRLQCAYTDTADTESIVGFLKEQTDSVEYADYVTKPRGESAVSESGGDGFSEDELFEDALNIVVNAQKASASMLQRKLRIGYNRAARLVDELHEAGVIGPQEGSNPRKVLISDVNQILGGSSATDEFDGMDNGIEEEIE